MMKTHKKIKIILCLTQSWPRAYLASAGEELSVCSDAIPLCLCSIQQMAPRAGAGIPTAVHFIGAGMTEPGLLSLRVWPRHTPASLQLTNKHSTTQVHPLFQLGTGQTCF